MEVRGLFKWDLEGLNAARVGGGPLGHPKIFINLVRSLLFSAIVCTNPLNRTSPAQNHAGM